MEGVEWFIGVVCWRGSELKVSDKGLNREEVVGLLKGVICLEGLSGWRDECKGGGGGLNNQAVSGWR